MRKATWIVTVAVLAVAGGVVSGFAGEEATPVAAATTNVVKHQTMCPVMGGEINKKVFVDYQGKRVYFCCKGCPPDFKKDPEKYIKKMEAEGITLDKTPPAATTKAPAATQR
jgi:YHS domain-containing protein